MKHCELFKLAPGADAVEVQHKIMKAFQKMDDELDWLNWPVVHRSCRAESDVDLMAVIDLDVESRLSELAANPHYEKLAHKLEGLVVARATFDHY